MRPSDDALWASVSETLRSVVLPNVDESFARNTVIQLIGLAQYARTRGRDESPRHLAELIETLDGLHPNRYIANVWAPETARTVDAVYEAASNILASAIGNDDDEACRVRAALRPLLIAELDHEMVSTAQLLAAFRGKLPSV